MQVARGHRATPLLVGKAGRHGRGVARRHRGDKPPVRRDLLHHRGRQSDLLPPQDVGRRGIGQELRLRRLGDVELAVVALDEVEPEQRRDPQQQGVGGDQGRQQGQTHGTLRLAPTRGARASARMAGQL